MGINTIDLYSIHLDDINCGENDLGTIIYVRRKID